MDRLTKEEVLHVSKLAKIRVDEKEIEKYQIELKKLLNQVEKINLIEIDSDEILIAPWSENITLRKDEPGDMLIKNDVLKNVPEKSGSYVEVPVVINE